MDVPVLIIGAGPSGATTALHLGRLGIKSLVVSRHRTTATTPRAHIFNQRAMEVLRDAEIEKKLIELASPTSDIQHVSWSDTLAGEEYARIWAWGNKPTRKGEYELASPCVMSDLPQNVLEPVIVEEAMKLGAEFRFYHEFLRVEQNEVGVTASLRDRNTGEEYQVHSQYMVGADGAKSAVITALGIPIIGKEINTAFNVHIKADLTKYIAHRPGGLNWILNTEAPEWSAAGNFRMVKPWTEFVVSMHPAHTDPIDFHPTTEAIHQRLRQLIGDDSVKVEILSFFSWSINDMVAEYYQKGRVLCIGDAVHRHPPINGLGSNTCISDAFNLAWKLAYTLKGWASPALLDTFTAERKPVGDYIVKRANSGMLVHRRLWNVLGLDPESRKTAKDELQAATAQGETKRQALHDAIEATDYEFQSLGVQMNQVYLNSPATFVEQGDHAPGFGDLNIIKHAKISTFPGYHLPHVWFVADGQSHRVSSLDLSGHGRFTLFTGIGGEAWVKAATDFSAAGKVQVKGFTIGHGRDYIDCYRDWCHVKGVKETGAVLVRPDCFVAWRCQELVDDPLSKLTSVLQSILGQSVLN